MKIDRIELNGFYQFKDMVIDLTYPKGHAKEGQPLDRVCLIGQSGTGKTTLLRLIKWFVSGDRRIGENVWIQIPKKGEAQMNFRLFDLHYALFNQENNLLYNSLGNDGKRVRGQTALTKLKKSISKQLEKISPLLINFPTELISKRELSEEDEQEDIEKRQAKKKYLENLEPGKVIDFAFQDIKEAWHFVLKAIKEHRAKVLYYNKRVGDAITQDLKMQVVEQRKVEYETWLQTNPDPLAILAEQCLDPVLEKIGLQVNREIGPETIMDLGFIQLQTLEGRNVPREAWSTGSWQLVQMLIPLFQLKPEHAVILMDEPERSLYPDIQTTIIDTCVSLAPGSQFFFATHSPMVASCFEPWEVVELKFDDEKKSVFWNRHYEGEHHVDSYRYNPKYLRWDSNLIRIFNLDVVGGKERTKKLEELADMKSRIHQLKRESRLESPEGQELVDRYLGLSEKLDWRIEK